MKYAVTNQQLLAVADAHKEAFLNVCGLETDNDMENDFFYFMSEMNSTTREWYADVGGLYVYGDQLHFDTDRFDTILAMSHVVFSEYEYGDGERVWDMLELSGDDDVDYASSYLDVIIDILKFYLSHK